MDHQQPHDDAVTPTERDYRDDNYQRSGATILFWLLLGFLIALGLCVVVSIILALVLGS